MLIKATLSNAMHPEYGEVTIPFPIKTSEYDRTMEMLANLEIGNVMGRDCKIMELSSPYSILQKLEGSEVNIDELDYLAKRLESFEADQDLQFQAAAFARGVASIEDFINLTFCSDQATVIYDFTKLEEAGRQHFMNLHGGCASTEELENLDGYETALLLIDGGGAEITPYGVLYDNGMQMEQLYKGGPFPPYLYDAYELVLPVSPTQSPQNKTYLYLPSSNLQLERTLLRGGIMEREGWFHKLEPIQLSSVITAKLDTRRDSIRELNEMCRSIHLLPLYPGIQEDFRSGSTGSLPDGAGARAQPAPGGKSGTGRSHHGWHEHVRKEKTIMKRKLAFCVAAMCLTMALAPSALAVETTASSPSTQVCYPTSVSRSEDGTEIRKYYDLSPEDDPAGIPRSDFEQDGFRYTLIDLLKQELPENESRQHTETVSLQSKSKDMESVLALLPQEKEFITEDGLSGVLTLRLDTVQVEVAGYGSSTRNVSATRSYPNLASQDTANIPKTIEDNGRTLTLQDIDWQTDNTATTDGYALGDRFTAVATYTGTATSSYVTGYTVTADYAGTVSRIALNKTRYVAIFEGTAIEPLAPLLDADNSPVQFNWAYILVPLGMVFAVGGVIGGSLLYKRRHENDEEGTE